MVAAEVVEVGLPVAPARAAARTRRGEAAARPPTPRYAGTRATRARGQGRAPGLEVQDGCFGAGDARGHDTNHLFFINLEATLSKFRISCSLFHIV